MALGCVDQAMKTPKTSHTIPRKTDPRSPFLTGTGVAYNEA